MKDEKKIINENSSLMKKTKAQLVEIILRKDEVERTIRKELKEIQESFSQKIKDYDNINIAYNNCVEDLSKANYNIGLIHEEYNSLNIIYKNYRRNTAISFNKYKRKLIYKFIFILILIEILTLLFL